MKRITFFLLLLPYFAIAQREIQSDTMWLTKQLVTAATDTTSARYEYFLNRRYDYTNGESVTQKLLLGDSATAINAITGQEIDAIRQHTYHAVQAMQKGRVIAEWQDVNAALKDVELPGLDTLIQALFEGQFLGDANVKIGSAAFIPADVAKNAAGNLRLIFAGTGYRVILYADTMIRVLGYPAAGQNTDLYKVRERVFRNVENTFTLRLR